MTAYLHLTLNTIPDTIRHLFPFQQHPLYIYLVLRLPAYLALVAILRFQRMRSLHRRDQRYSTRESLPTMTDHDAWEIQKLILQLEFPFMALKSLQFAPFRVCHLPHRHLLYLTLTACSLQTYGIPSISTLLAQTSQFSHPSTAFKRYADTSTLIGEFMAFPPSSDRAHTGHRAHQLPAQRIPRQRTHPRRRHAVHAEPVRAAAHPARRAVRVARVDAAREMRHWHVLEESGRCTQYPLRLSTVREARLQGWNPLVGGDCGLE